MAFRLKLACIAVVILLLAAAGESATDFLWQDQVAGETNRTDGVRAMAAEGDRVFAAGLVQEFSRNHFVVRAYDAWNGSLLWEDRVTTVNFFGAIALAIEADGGRVFVGGGFGGRWMVRAYDSVTGALLWEDLYGGSSQALTDIAVSDDAVFVVGNLDNVFGIRAYDAQTGILRWEDRASDAGFGMAHSVEVHGGTVFATGADPGTVNITRAYDRHSGALLWQAPRGDDYMSVTLAADDARVITAGRIRHPLGQSDFAVRAHDRFTGELLWEDRVYGVANGSGYAADVVTNGRVVYVVGSIQITSAAFTGELAVRAYDADTGRVLWMDIVGRAGPSEEARAVALRGGQLIVAGSLDVLGTDMDLVVRTYDAETGELLWDDFVNGTANGFDRAWAVAVLPHAVYVGGEIRNVGSGIDFYVRGYYK